MADWIKVHRKLLDNPIMHHDGLCRLWLYCLLRANWKPAKVLLPGTTRSYDVPRGSFLTGRFSLHSALYPASDKREMPSPSESTVWRWLKSLENMGCLNLKSVDGRCTMISICNYSTYQDSDRTIRTAGEQPVNSTRTAGEQPVNTEEERKEIQEWEEGKEQDTRDDQIDIYETSFKAMPFPKRFEAIVAAHPNKSPSSRAVPFWKNRATSEDAVEEIEAGHAAWVKSKNWQDGIGIPTLANFLREEWYKNHPTVFTTRNPADPPKQREQLMTDEEIAEFARKGAEAAR